MVLLPSSPVSSSVLWNYTKWSHIAILNWLPKYTSSCQVLYCGLWIYGWHTNHFDSWVVQFVLILSLVIDRANTFHCLKSTLSTCWVIQLSGGGTFCSWTPSCYFWLHMVSKKKEMMWFHARGSVSITISVSRSTHHLRYQSNLNSFQQRCSNERYIRARGSTSDGSFTTCHSYSSNGKFITTTISPLCFSPACYQVGCYSCWLFSICCRSCVHLIRYRSHPWLFNRIPQEEDTQERDKNQLLSQFAVDSFRSHLQVIMFLFNYPC